MACYLSRGRWLFGKTEKVYNFDVDDFFKFLYLESGTAIMLLSKHEEGKLSGKYKIHIESGDEMSLQKYESLKQGSILIHV